MMIAHHGRITFLQKRDDVIMLCSLSEVSARSFDGSDQDAVSRNLKKERTNMTFHASTEPWIQKWHLFVYEWLSHDGVSTKKIAPHDVVSLDLHTHKRVPRLLSHKHSTIHWLLEYTRPNCLLLHTPNTNSSNSWLRQRRTITSHHFSNIGVTLVLKDFIRDREVSW